MLVLIVFTLLMDTAEPLWGEKLIHTIVNKDFFEPSSILR